MTKYRYCLYQYRSNKKVFHLSIIDLTSYRCWDLYEGGYLIEYSVDTVNEFGDYFNFDKVPLKWEE